MTPPPLSLYLHFPWCVSKCPYCDFNSHALKTSLPETGYIDALLADLDAQAGRVPGQVIQSVFMGGGTPSLFSPAALGGLLDAIRSRLPMDPAAEITMEANPATVERGRFAEYGAAGINRVSLGAQSFDKQALKALGRIHSPADVRRAAEELHSCGLSNFNLDLMYALPDQSVDAALRDIDAALTLRPAHVSHYQLTLEPGTVFAARPPALPDDDQAWQMQQECQQRLRESGFEQYEVSGYARTGKQCRHNLNYWRFGDYLGVGAGAHGKITGTQVERSRHLREPRRYLDSAGQGPEWVPVPPTDLPFEYMMNALRLNEGFELQEFVERTALTPAAILPTLRKAAEDGLLEADGERWRCTALGTQFLNDLLQRFLPGEISSDRAAG